MEKQYAQNPAIENILTRRSIRSYTDQDVEPEKIEAIRDWGKERAVPASGKPIGGEELIQKKSGPKTRKVLV